MNFITNQLIIFLTFFIILVVLYILFRAVKWYFEIQLIKAKSTNGVSLTALSVLLIAFLALNSFWSQIMQITVQVVNNKYPNLKINIPSNTENNILYFILVIGTIFICIINYIKFQKLKKQSTVNNEEFISKNITAPPDIIPEPITFHEKIENLFNLKYKKFNPKINEIKSTGTNKIFYLHYKDELKNYYRLVYCWNDIDKTVKIEEQKLVYEELNNIYKELTQKIDNSIDYYYLICNGKIEINRNHSHNMICFNEDGFVNSLIDFSPYLKELVKKFNFDKLPFSSIDKETTLKQTFIFPTYNNGKKDLEKMLDNWLNEKSNRHIALLGDYGTGKTSYMKYYAYKLANDILENKKIKRFPILISLTSKSPMHGGIEYHIKSFLAEQNLDTNYELFQKLIHKGKIVFLLDGFDEMGFIGTHNQRFEQLNAIWQLATKSNKIIISGRPSYFPDQFEEQHYLNIVEENEIVPQEKPFSSRIELDFFNPMQILDSIKSYYPKKKEHNKYFDYIKKNKSIFELCRRPSMLHIVREMLPSLFNNKVENIKAGNLMKSYIDHWIQRQFDKSIVSAIKDVKIKKEFIFNFYMDLAAENYDYENGNISLTAQDILKFLKSKIELHKINVKSDDELQGFESEILTGYFIERNESYYGFVHKSFLEYFVAQKIIQLIRENKFSNWLIEECNWTNEIQDFVYESVANEELEKSEYKQIPLLLYLAQSKYSLFLSILYRLYAKLNFAVNNAINYLLIVVFGFSKSIATIYFIILIPILIIVNNIFFNYTNLFRSITFSIFSIFIYSLLIVWRKIHLHSNFGRYRFLLLYVLLLAYISLIIYLMGTSHLFVNREVSTNINSSNLYFIIIIIISLILLYFRLNNLINLKLIKKSFYISINRGYLPLDKYYFIYYSIIDDTKTLNLISNVPLKQNFVPIFLFDCVLFKTDLTSFNVEFESTKFLEVNFIGEFLNLKFNKCQFYQTNFENILPFNIKYFIMKFEQTHSIDSFSVESLKKLIEIRNLKIGENIIVDEWLVKDLKRNEISKGLNPLKLIKINNN